MRTIVSKERTRNEESKPGSAASRATSSVTGKVPERTRWTTSERRNAEHLNVSAELNRQEDVGILVTVHGGRRHEVWRCVLCDLEMRKWILSNYGNWRNNKNPKLRETCFSETCALPTAFLQVVFSSPCGTETDTLCTRQVLCQSEILSFSLWDQSLAKLLRLAAYLRSPRFSLLRREARIISMYSRAWLSFLWLHVSFQLTDSVNFQNTDRRGRESTVRE